MPFILIKGTFHVTGYSPDGDSMKFKAKKEANWNKLAGRPAKRNQKKHVQMRFEGVDTPETHYMGGSQPHALADAATDFTLGKAGIDNVVWSKNRYRVTSADDGTEGYILSREVEKNGRPVSFVFTGSTDLKDGGEVYLKPTLLKKSINYKLLKAGFAYPTYYEGLFADLRETLTAATVAARNAGKGIWPKDKSAGVTVTGMPSITDKHTIFPKLFRRLLAYLKSRPSVAGFKQSLADRPEKIMILPRGHFAHFDDVIKQDGNRIAMTVKQENLVFRP